MFRREVIVLALVFTAPVLWQALVEETVSWETVGIRYLIALPVAALLVALVRWAARPRPVPADQDTSGGAAAAAAAAATADWAGAPTEQPPPAPAP